MFVNNLRKPKSYLREIPVSQENFFVSDILAAENINTICENARCPNRAECFSCGTASILALGNICTRNCKFCAVKKGAPLLPDKTEPQRIANAVRKLNLTSVVITSPTRDDLKDGGAKHLSDCVFAVKKECPNCKVELLISDFNGSKTSLEIIVNLPLDCISHNIEMPKNLYEKIRRTGESKNFADFYRSIKILKYLKKKQLRIKTGFMLGLGETENEIFDLIKTLAEIPVDILTIGQYFQPETTAFPVQKYYEESDFERFADLARKFGISNVLSGVFVRSSYKNNL